MIELCRDPEAIRAICIHPDIFPHISDDYSTPETWHVPALDYFRFYLASDEQGACGFAAFHPRNLACWETHCGFLPRAYGKALPEFRTAIDIMLKTAHRLVGEVDVENRRAIAFAKRAGFQEYGLNRKSVLRNGVLRDQICLGLSKE